MLRVHAFLVGLMTNLLFGVIAVRTRRAPIRFAWAEPTAMWVLNAGVVVFVGVEAAMQVSHGAAVMGVGVLLGVGTMLRRLQDAAADAAASVDGTASPAAGQSDP